jgi:hypothetical protein
MKYALLTMIVLYLLVYGCVPDSPKKGAEEHGSDTPTAVTVAQPETVVPAEPAEAQPPATPPAEEPPAEPKEQPAAPPEAVTAPATQAETAAQQEEAVRQEPLAEVVTTGTAMTEDQLNLAIRNMVAATNDMVQITRQLVIATQEMLQATRGVAVEMVETGRNIIETEKPTGETAVLPPAKTE